ncbi:MAG: DHH family phosphoesterase [Candidatus Gracilibacteria bacterium]
MPEFVEKDLLITAYENPDLDGSACAYGYAEFLRKCNRRAIAGVFGQPDLESQFVFRTFNIDQPVSAEKIIDDIEKIVIVDASDANGLADSIDPAKVVEVIDHRKVNSAHIFPNAEIHIEMVGAAATLIAEKFYVNDIPLSSSSAALLFSAIVSNTVNFRAGVTTHRDSKMAKWCLDHFSLPENYVKEMFAAKSKLDKPLKDILMFASFEFGEYKVAIAQLEINDVDAFVEERLPEIEEILLNTKNLKGVDIAFLTCIDVDQGFNTLVACDSQSRRCLAEALDIKFDGNVAWREGVLMRKEIAPLIEKILNKGDLSFTLK